MFFATYVSSGSFERKSGHMTSLIRYVRSSVIFNLRTPIRLGDVIQLYIEMILGCFKDAKTSSRLVLPSPCARLRVLYSRSWLLYGDKTKFKMFYYSCVPIILCNPVSSLVFSFSSLISPYPTPHSPPQIPKIDSTDIDIFLRLLIHLLGIASLVYS